MDTEECSLECARMQLSWFMRAGGSSSEFLPPKFTQFSARLERSDSIKNAGNQTGRYFFPDSQYYHIYVTGQSVDISILECDRIARKRFLSGSQVLGALTSNHPGTEFVVIFLPFRSLILGAQEFYLENASFMFGLIILWATFADELPTFWPTHS